MLRQVLLLLLILSTATLSAAPPRQVALTFDDLPDLSADSHSVAEMEAMTEKLLRGLREQHLPATGFVNEDKLLIDCEGGDAIADPRRVALLRAWLDSGFDLGNHTCSHMDLHVVQPELYQADILRGETIIRPLSLLAGRPLRWFRHPYLNTGTSLEVRQKIETFLDEHGYRVAPVTIDDSEWIFDVAYDRAVAGHHPITRLRVAHTYLRYMQARFAFAEQMSRLTFGREIPQVLLLHASQLNADYLGALKAVIAKRGYRFVTLDQATSDPAYTSPDTWTGGGVGWIERWAVSAGKSEEPFDADPKVPQWVQKMAGAVDE
jgi:peptidoglycan/xylan/chitin deacetylase (PgdA/CDA1 family)